MHRATGTVLRMHESLLYSIENLFHTLLTIVGWPKHRILGHLALLPSCSYKRVLT